MGTLGQPAAGQTCAKEKAEAGCGVLVTSLLEVRYKVSCQPAHRNDIYWQPSRGRRPANHGTRKTNYPRCPLLHNANSPGCPDMNFFVRQSFGHSSVQGLGSPAACRGHFGNPGSLGSVSRPAARHIQPYCVLVYRTVTVRRRSHIFCITTLAVLGHSFPYLAVVCSLYVGS
ncbi:hypothetical protein BT67DRAFT_103793 [Trichocladium antarcticum]|uniref:Uncharacterized protein n=1 Tax=Trichocladium antarcticum TaxID=1450529 RepID=A0AAN6USZ5_9PEZI|nr:hypothetical protein BT67DRAFT_103793 [Trichocladium antarcticum]